MKRSIVPVSVFMAIMLSLTSCGDTSGFLHDMLDIEARVKKDTPPSTISELKQGIAKYGAEVEKTFASMEKIAMYWRILATKYAQKGMYGEAYDASLKAIRFYPDNSGLYYLAGLSASSLAKSSAAELRGATRLEWLETAKAAYRQSIKLNEKNTKPMLGLAMLFAFEYEDHASAIPLLETFLAIDTKNIDALLLYARSLYGAGRLQDAVEVYDKVIEATVLDEVKKRAKENKQVILKELYG
jgi:tetratricopeptide (TPR) repeat protein